MVQKPAKLKEIELESDAWERFERAVKVVAKSPPQHRTKARKTHKSTGKKKRSKLSPRDKRTD